MPLPTRRTRRSASAANAIAGSIATSAFMCRRRCTRGAASIDPDCPGDALRAVSRLAEGAGILSCASRRAAARASNVPHVLARTQRWLVAARAPLRPQAGAAGQGVLRNAGFGAVFADAVVGQ